MIKGIFMKRILFLVLITFSVPLYSQQAITILDFDVQSDNEEHKYLGKGFAQFLSVELSQIKTITLVEREKRNEIINELKFGLTGLVDENNLIELGNMLQSNYLVAGEIFDMAGTLVITTRIIDIEKSTIIAQSGADGTAGEYKKITRQLAISILDALGVEMETTLPDIEGTNNDEAVLASFSKAVDAYDEGDKEKAIKEIRQAKELDRGNIAIKKLENKLIIISPKFQFEDPMWMSPYNPASSAILKKYLFYFRWDTYQEFLIGETDPDRGLISAGDPSNPTYIDGYPFLVKSHIGFNFKVSDNIGINTELNVPLPIEQFRVTDVNGDDRDIPVLLDGIEKTQGSDLVNEEVYLQITGGLSYKISEILSLGLNSSIIFPLREFNTEGIPNRPYSNSDEQLLTNEGNLVQYSPPGGEEEDIIAYALPDKIGFTINPGIVLYLLSSRIIIDINSAIPINHVRYFYDYDQDAFVNGTWPIYFSASINGTIIKNHLFFGLKSNLDFYKDSEAKGIFLKETPVIEFWPTTFLAFRGGYIFSFFSIDGRSSLGHGILAGLSIKLKRIDFDINYNNRKTPFTSVEGTLVPTGSFIFSFTFQ
jgi:TolB-like protein